MTFEFLPGELWWVGRTFDGVHMPLDATATYEVDLRHVKPNAGAAVMLVSLKAAGTGITLHAADYVFLLDPWWNPAVEAQAVDRAHRIGQKRNVMVYKFITKNTVEEKILRLQQHKQQLMTSLITKEDGFIKSLTREDLDLLLE